MARSDGEETAATHSHAVRQHVKPTYYSRVHRTSWYREAPAPHEYCWAEAHAAASIVRRHANRGAEGRAKAKEEGQHVGLNNDHVFIVNRPFIKSELNKRTAAGV